MVAELRAGIYKALETERYAFNSGTTVEFVAGQVEETTHRPCIKIIVTPQTAKAVNPYVYIVTYKLAVAWYTTDFYDFEDEGQELLEYMFEKLTKEIKVEADGGVYITIDNMKGDLLQGVAVVEGTIDVDIRREESDDEDAQGELMEELILNLEEAEE